MIRQPQKLSSQSALPYSGFLEKTLAGLVVVLPPLLLIFWPLGINTKDTARAALITSLVLWILSRRKLADVRALRLTQTLFFLFPFVFVTCMCAYQLARVYIGDQGLDFAIFTQAIRSIRDVGQPLTTLVSPHEVNFLSHHFALFLYPLGWLTRLGIAPHIIGIVAQFTSIGLGLLFFFLFCRTLRFSRGTAAVCTTLLCLHPSFRSGISWGIHDEIFALGIIGAAIYSWAHQRHIIVACCLVVSAFFKETFFIASFIASSLALWTLYLKHPEQKRYSILYAILTAFFFCAAITYFIMIPLFPHHFPLSFNAASRIATLESWLSGAFLGAKLGYFVQILLPLALLPLCSRRALALWLCAAPFWGASLVSGFADMHDPYNYYAVAPTFLAFFAAALALSELRPALRDLSAPVIFITTCLALSFGYGIRPLKHTRALTSQPPFPPESLQSIPYDSTVVASDFDLALILDKKTPLRQWMVERNPMKWDILLARKPPKQPVSDTLRRKTTLCYEDDRWQLFCRRKFTLPPQDSPYSKPHP